MPLILADFTRSRAGCKRMSAKPSHALRANKPNNALNPLNQLSEACSNNAEIEYLFGLYSSEMKDDAKARSHWMKTLELNPRHLEHSPGGPGRDLVQSNKSAEAIPYATRAVQTEPASWRAHLLLAEALGDGEAATMTP